MINQFNRNQRRGNFNICFLLQISLFFPSLPLFQPPIHPLSFFPIPFLPHPSFILYPRLPFLPNHSSIPYPPPLLIPFCSVSMVFSFHVVCFHVVPFPVVLFPCCSVSVLFSFHVVLFSCYSVSMLSSSMLFSFHVVQFPCCSVSMLFCFHVVLFPCSSVFMLTRFQIADSF